MGNIRCPGGRVHTICNPLVPREDVRGDVEGDFRDLAEPAGKAKPEGRPCPVMNREKLLETLRDIGHRQVLKVDTMATGTGTTANHVP